MSVDRLPSLLVMCAALALSPLPGSAQGSPASTTDESYRHTIDEALSEYDAGRYEEARALFERAHALSPTARTLRGRGMAEFELRHYGACVTLLKEALSSAVKPLDGKLRADTEALLARAQTFAAAITVRVTPSQATLLLDGAPVDPGHSGPFYLDIGTHTLEATAPGHRDVSTRVSVHGGESRSVVLALEPAAQAMDTRSSQVGPSDTKRSWYKNPWLWTAAGVVVAGGAAGAAVAATRDGSSPRAYGGTSGALLSGP